MAKSKNTTKADNATKVKDDIVVESFARTLHAVVNGAKVAEVKQIDNPDTYRQAGYQVYSKTAVKGKSAGQTIWCVQADASVKRSSGASLKAKAGAMLASGKTKEEVLAELFGL